MQRFLVVKVNCSSPVFNDNKTHLNIEEGQKSEQIVVKVSESAHPKICLHFASRLRHTRKTTKTILSVDCIAVVSS